MDPQPKPGFLPVDQYLQLPRDRATYLLKPLLPVSGACLIYGSQKQGKSYMAIQLALALTGQLPDFLGFPVGKTGKVCYLQLDTPRVVWAERFDKLRASLRQQYDWNNILVADRESIDVYPFDIVQPQHTNYLHRLIRQQDPIAVIVDTLRESNSGDENDSTQARNVITALVGAVHPAALILVNHDRKGSPDQEKDIMADHRGSNYVVGRMDTILRLTKRRLYYAGRTLEAGDIRLERVDNGLWSPIESAEASAALEKVLCDSSLDTLRAKARVLAQLTAIGEEAAMSRIRRHQSTLHEGHRPMGDEIMVHPTSS